MHVDIPFSNHRGAGIEPPSMKFSNKTKICPSYGKARTDPPFFSPYHQKIGLILAYSPGPKHQETMRARPA